MKIKAPARLWWGPGGVPPQGLGTCRERMSDLCCSAPSRYPSTRHMPALYHAHLSLGLSKGAGREPRRGSSPETGELPVKCQALTG